MNNLKNTASLDLERPPERLLSRAGSEIPRAQRFGNRNTATQKKCLVPGG